MEIETYVVENLFQGFSTPGYVCDQLHKFQPGGIPLGVKFKVNMEINDSELLN